MNTINTTLKTIVTALEDKKAEEIQLIDISGVSTIADYFVITNGINVSQIQALADNVEEKLNTNGIHPRSVEGYNTANWILMDYNDILVHIFDKESRGFYDLERMWRDGKVIDIKSTAL
ncbi:MAG: ribosome silencing factor [Lachnospiraceae bacterium]|nr:ribosome silencing factor [Lachnospiraceae bacterium]MDE7415227.1 ribosome silencing factor [Lachnospiraceae bacterium]